MRVNKALRVGRSSTLNLHLTQTANQAARTRTTKLQPTIHSSKYLKYRIRHISHVFVRHRKQGSSSSALELTARHTRYIYKPFTPHSES